MRPRGTLGLMFAADRIQDLIRRLRDDVAAVVRAEIELAKTEVTEKVRTQGKAAALIAVAAAFALLALLAFEAGAIAGLATAVPLWASALIVGAVLLLIAALLAWLGIRASRKAGMPTPDAAIIEAKATVDELKEEAHIRERRDGTQASRGAGRARAADGHGQRAGNRRSGRQAAGARAGAGGRAVRGRRCWPDHAAIGHAPQALAPPPWRSRLT